MQLSRLSLALTIVAILAHPVLAQDSGAGEWHGVVEPRLNYYWETSTRVVVPTFHARADSPGGLRVGAGYLIDAITSASVGQTGSDKDGSATEYRHAGDAELSQDFDLGDSQLRLGVHGIYSKEPDYRSANYGLDTALTFNEKATRASFTITRIDDRIRSNADPLFHATLDGVIAAVAVEHALNPLMLLTVGYQIGYADGYLGNPYRRALRGPLPFRENPPSRRVRHTAMGHIAWFIPETITSLHLMVNAYTDSWELKAINPEIRICQELGRDLMVRPHYRFYTQTKAWFAIDGAYPRDWTGPLTNDPKMPAMTTHTLGLTAEVALAFLADTVLDFGKGIRLDLNFDRYWSTSRFGNGIIASAGGRIEF
jgi:hypothetical protein